MSLTSDLGLYASTGAPCIMDAVPVRSESQIRDAIAANEALIADLRSAVARTLAVEGTVRVIDLRHPLRSPGRMFLAGAPAA